jgi:indolepyruvate ferredoxin oxidoreductase alpha subunit
MDQERQLLNGDEAVALAALHAGVALGTGYPGTPSTEILETLDHLGGRAQWSPNEKVALEVGIGVAFAGGRALVTMKHVGLNVAADPLFTATYTDVEGGLVIVSADDPGMASSQNEQDNRHYARAAVAPMLEPCDSQEAYDFTLLAFEISERWKIPVILRLTTRVCHSKTLVQPRAGVAPPPAPGFRRDVPARVMIPPTPSRPTTACATRWPKSPPGTRPRGPTGSSPAARPWASSAAASPPCMPRRRRPTPATWSSA